MFYNDKVRNSSGEPNNSKWNLANNKAYEYMRQELVEIDEKIVKSIITGDFNTTLSVVDKAIRQKNSVKFKRSK